MRRSIDGLVEDGHPELTCLCPKLFSVDPDDAFSSVPYEKGFNLLYYLETLLGGPNVFEPYVKAHFDKFAHTSITTQKFKDFLYWYFMKPEFDGEKVKLLDSVDWTNWFSGVGMPKQSNHFDQTLSQACEKLADVWTSGSDSVSPSDLDSFSPSQKMSFLDILLSRTPMDHNRIKKMGDLYKFNGFKNCEIRFRWQYLCLKAEYEPIFPEVTKFVVEIGRMKYVRPLYKALFKCKNGKKLAVDTFLANKSFYHSICAYGVSKDLELIK